MAFIFAKIALDFDRSLMKIQTFTQTNIKLAQLFAGKLYFCEGPDVRNVTNKTDCLNSPDNEWLNAMYNYDNVVNSLFTLFIIATKDGWVDAMYNGIDAVGIDQQPVKNHNEYMAAFFIVYLLVVGFFVVNMFIGVIIDNFHRCREAQAEEENRLNQEKKARKAQKLLNSKSARFVQSFLRKILS
jgi:voltage-dependent calcium channel T type alpha-1G